MKKAFMYLILVFITLVSSHAVFGYGFEKIINADSLTYFKSYPLTDTTFLFLGVTTESYEANEYNYEPIYEPVLRTYNINGELLSENKNLPGQWFPTKDYNYDESPFQPLVLNNGNFVTLWHKNQNSINYYLSFISPQCSIIGYPVFINPNKDGWGNKSQTMIKRLSDNSLLILWYKLHDGIYTQIISSEGTRVNNEKKMWGLYPCDGFIELKNGNLVFTRSHGANDFIIFTDHLEYLVNNYLYTGSERYNKSVKNLFALDNGNFVIIWESQSGETNGNLYSQYFSSDGTPVSEKIQLMKNWFYGTFDYTVALPMNNNIVFINYLDDSYYTDEKDKLLIQKIDQSGVLYQTKIDMSAERYNDASLKVLKLSEDKLLILLARGINNWGYIYDVNSNSISEKFYTNPKNLGYGWLEDIIQMKDNSLILIFRIWQKNKIIMKRFKSEPQYHTLKPFQVIGPANDQSINITNPTFIWTQPSDSMVSYPFELKYEVHLSESPDFTDPIINNIDGDTTLTIRNLSPGITYFWQVKATNLSNEEIWSDNVNAFFVRESASTGIENESETPYKYELMNNYPNPFNGSTTLSYTLQNPGHVSIMIYNMLGQKVATLVDGYQADIQNTVKWNGTNDYGEPVTSGIYFAKMQSGDYTKTIKMAFVE